MHFQLIEHTCPEVESCYISLFLNYIFKLCRKQIEYELQRWILVFMCKDSYVGQ